MRPCLGFVGPLLGHLPGFVASQAEFLADAFEARDYPVVRISKVKNRYFRLLNTAWELLACRKKIEVQCQQIYGGPSFVVEDLASFIGKSCGFKVVMHLHGGNIPKFMTQFPRWSRKVLCRANKIVVPSLYLRRFAEGMGFAPVIIPNFIYIQKYPFLHRKFAQPRLFWMRTFEESYHPKMAILVFAEIRKRYPDATLTMAGADMGLLEKSKGLAREMRLDEVIRFTGQLDQESKVREAANHDIYLNTTRTDNMPVSLIEMGALGLPIVTTDAGGIPDMLVNDHTGLIVPTEDVNGMATAVFALLENQSLVSKLSENGRKQSEQFSWEKVCIQWEKLFDSLGKD